MSFLALPASAGPLSAQSLKPPAPPPYLDEIERVYLTFTVSVCLDDFEYSIACWERSSLEAARRLEQIYLDDFASKRATGTLSIWFPIAAEHGEQSRFLREVENRAIESVFRKLKDDVEHLAAAAAAAQTQSSTQIAAIQQIAQQVRRWHDEAVAEARGGTNWSHDWGSRTHTYKSGPALDDLLRIAGRIPAAS